MDGGAIGIETLWDFDRLAAVRSFWESAEDHANNDRAHFELICRLRPEVVAPCVTIVTEAGRTCGLVVGRMERTRFAPTIGYLKPISMAATVLVVIHRGVVGQLDAEMAGHCISEMRSLLSTVQADAVEFHHLSEDSPLLAALAASGPQRLWRRLPCWSTHRSMTVPGSGSFMDQRIDPKHRTHFRKRQRCLHADFAGRLSWRWVAHCDDVGALCDALESVARGTYQRGLGVGFVDGPEIRERLVHFAGRDQLRVQLLEIDGTVRAFWLGTVYKGIFHSSETGYDPALRTYEVGSLMFFRLTDALIGEGVRAIDFGLGDAFYKERFGDVGWRETSVWMFAPTFRGIVMRVVLEATLIIDRSARAMTARLGVTDRLKRGWRRAVTDGPSRRRGSLVLKVLGAWRRSP